ncbi:MAG: ABC transporter permease [Pirellulaceae bacterium]
MTLINLALKDLRLLARDRMSAFFVFGFPIMMGLFFGMILGGFSSGTRGKMEIAVIDLDQSPMSKRFVESLQKNDNIKVVTDELEAAKESVRKARRTGLLVIPEKFGESAGIFWEPQPELQLGMDPSRAAESAMMEGFVMQAVAELMGERFRDPSAFLPSISKAKESFLNNESTDAVTKQVGGLFFGSLEAMVNSAGQLQDKTETADGGFAPSLQFANIKPLDISRQLDPDSPEAQVKKIRSRWDISFPQAMLWGILGCIAGFSVSIAKERSQGTLVRLQAAPLSRMQIMLGKALACFLATLLVMVLMVALGLLLKMQPGSYLKLAVVGVCTATCFVGIMMTLSVLGKTEQSVAGVGWAFNMVMAMLGGCMIPVMFMPAIFQKISVISPVRWAILGIEGAIWRDFSWSELFLPMAIMVSVGVVGFAVGTTIMMRRNG